VAWNPNGKQIAVGTYSAGVTIYDANTGDELPGYDRHFSGYRGSNVQGMAWSPNGKYIASGIDDDWSGSRSTGISHGFNSVDVWEVATQHKLSTCHWSFSDLPAIAITWSLDGRQVVIVVGDEDHDPGVTVYDATTGQEVLSYRGPSSTGQGVLSYQGPSSNETCPSDANGVAWSPDKTCIASTSDSTVHLWNAATGQTILVHHGTPGTSVKSVAWSPDGRYIASGDTGNTVQVWETATGRIIVTYNGHTDAINAVAWSPDGQHIASGSEDKTVQVWQAV